MSHENCDNCENDYDFTPQTTNIHIFLGSPVVWLDALCPHCGSQERIFVGVQSALQLIAAKCVNILMGDKPPADMAGRWAEMMDVEPKNVTKPSMTSEKPGYTLTPRLESVVAALHRLLAAMPDKDLIEELELPAPKSNLPLTWRGEDGAPGASV